MSVPPPPPPPPPRPLVTCATFDAGGAPEKKCRSPPLWDLRDFRWRRSTKKKCVVPPPPFYKSWIRPWLYAIFSFFRHFLPEFCRIFCCRSFLFSLHFFARIFARILPELFTHFARIFYFFGGGAQCRGKVKNGGLRIKLERENAGSGASSGSSSVKMRGSRASSGSSSVKMRGSGASSGEQRAWKCRSRSGTLTPERPRQNEKSGGLRSDLHPTKKKKLHWFVCHKSPLLTPSSDASV